MLLASLRPCSLNASPRYEKALQGLQAKQVQDNDALSQLAREIEALQVRHLMKLLHKKGCKDTISTLFQSAVSSLALEVESSRTEVTQVEGDLREWEERLRACRTTREAVSRGRGREGELEGLRAEVHLLRSRAEEVDRKTRSLAEQMRQSVARREGMVDRAGRREDRRKSKRNEQVDRAKEQY